MPNDSCDVAELTESVSSNTVNETSRSSLLRYYEAIAQASCAMLAAAHAEDWTEVTRQEERCRALIAALKAADDAPLSAVEDAVRMRLLRQMLADDAQVRDQAEPWLEQISSYISTMRARNQDPK
jgi:flagellar protein FliT